MYLLRMGGWRLMEGMTVCVLLTFFIDQSSVMSTKKGTNGVISSIALIFMREYQFKIYYY